MEVVFIWRGGMSFHGGLLGVLTAIWLFARSRGVSYFTLSDIVGAATPIGLCLGRIANFINGELYGRTTDSTVVPWAMVFREGGPIARHPSQLYEALLEGVVLFVRSEERRFRERVCQYVSISVVAGSLKKK